MKAILVMDMPERCEDCDKYFVDYDRASQRICLGLDWEHIEQDDGKPDWCPLIPAIGYVEAIGNMVSWEDDDEMD